MVHLTGARLVVLPLSRLDFQLVAGGAHSRPLGTRRPATLSKGKSGVNRHLFVLWAYVYAEKVAYVSGLRQFSIVLAVLGGVLFLRGSGGRIRVFASIVIVAGLFLIGVAGGP